MAAKTYTPVMSDHKLIDIVEYLHQQTGACSASQIATALGIPHGTVMSHMAVLLERKWVRMNGVLYESGSRIAGMYAVYVMGLRNRRSDIDQELQQLEV